MRDKKNTVLAAGGVMLLGGVVVGVWVSWPAGVLLILGGAALVGWWDSLVWLEVLDD